MLKNSVGGKIAAAWLGLVVFCAIFGPLLPVAKVGQTFNDGLHVKPFTNCSFMGPLAHDLSPSSSASSKEPTSAPETTIAADNGSSLSPETVTTDTTAAKGITDEDGFTEEIPHLI